MQKTAYELRISDWSSYVCSSDLVLDGDRVGRSSHLLLDQVLDATVAWIVDLGVVELLQHQPALGLGQQRQASERLRIIVDHRLEHRAPIPQTVAAGGGQIGRASCRERAGQYV